MNINIWKERGKNPMREQQITRRGKKTNIRIISKQKKSVRDFLLFL